MRRRGSAAPQSNWSPQVNAATYCGPIFILRTRPTGMARVPDTAVGVSSARDAALLFGTSYTQSLSLSISASISSIGRSLFRRIVSAWL